MFYPTCTNFLSPRSDNVLAFSLRENDYVFDADLNSIKVSNIGKTEQKKCRILTMEDDTILPMCEINNKVPFVDVTAKNDKDIYISLRKAIKSESVNKGTIFALAPSTGDLHALNKINEEINSTLSSDDKFFLDVDKVGVLKVYYNRKEIVKPKSGKKYIGDFNWNIAPGITAFNSSFEEDKKEIEKQKLIENLKKTGSVVLLTDDFRDDDATFDYLIVVVYSKDLNITLPISNSEKLIKNFPIKKIVSISESKLMECVDLIFDSVKKPLLTTAGYNVI